MVTTRPSHLAAASAAALLLALRSAGACSVLPSTKYNNSDFVDGDGPRQADSLDECSGLCASMAACAFYSFQVDPSVNGTSCRWATLTHCCWLHTSAANAIADPTFTSGAVFDGSACPPPPGPCTAAAEGECGAAGSRFCHCEWNATGRISPPSPPFCAISSSPYPLPDNRSIAALVAPQTPLQPNTRVAFFGDSLTWLGLYEEVLTAALGSSPTTAHMNVTLVNEGVNGGTASDLVLGFSPWGALVPNRTFAEVLGVVQPDVVAIQIGINDILQLPCGPRCSNVSEFSRILRTELVDVALATGAAVYVASVSVIGEAPPFNSTTDELLDSFARAAMVVAGSAGVPFVDLRDDYKDYDIAENCLLVHSGLVTYDGIHPTSPNGATLLANAHAGGIIAAIESKSRSGAPWRVRSGPRPAPPPAPARRGATPSAAPQRWG